MTIRRFTRAVAVPLLALGMAAGLAGAPASGSEVPAAPTTAADRASRDVTIDDLRTMFPGRVGDGAVVAEGLSSLNQAMRDAGITTAARRAAFLTTVAYESVFLYNVRGWGDRRSYGGRGYIQLTGKYNYGAAGDYFGVDLVSHPDEARTLKWSAPIARWYWTVNRDINPMADALDMGRVNAAIGYPPGPHDEMRCEAFKTALAFYLGSVPAGVNCVRPKSYLAIETSTSHLSRAQWETIDD